MANEEIISASDWEESASIVFACRSGRKVRVRRVTQESLLLCGRLPQALLSRVLQMFKDIGKLSPPESAEGFETEQVAAMPDVVDAYLIAGLDGPFAVLGPADTSKNQINVRRIPDEDRMDIYGYIQAGCPDIPVKLESGGETSVEALANFPDGGGGQDGTSTSEDGKDVRRETVAAGGH
jgi:hypothetical protein